MILNDRDGRWTAAAYLVGDAWFQGTQHGIGDEGTLCGLSKDQVVIVRNPFSGRGPNDCSLCTERLRDMAFNAADKM